LGAYWYHRVPDIHCISTNEAATLTLMQKGRSKFRHTLINIMGNSGLQALSHAAFPAGNEPIHTEEQYVMHT